jgi:hypothetical protein
VKKKPGHIIPLRLRFAAAAEVAKYRHATMRAVAHVPGRTTAKMIDAARERAAKVVQLQIVPALPPVEQQQHPPSELKPLPSSAANGGFKRRI